MNITESKPFYDILLEKRLEVEFNTSEVTHKTTNISDGRIRIYDGKHWYVFNYVDTCIRNLQREAKKLIANYEVKSKENITKHKKVVGEENIKLNEFSLEDYQLINLKQKVELLKEIKSNVTYPVDLYYHDLYIEKHFITERVKRSYNLAGFGIGIKMKYDGNMIFYTKTYPSYNSLLKHRNNIFNYCNECADYIKATNYLNKGKYSVIFAQEVTGILVHECFGHIFEADVRYENDKGERLSNHSKLNIYDDGRLLEIGYCPFDDDGIIKTNTQIIVNGVIKDYLSDRQTALDLGIYPSGNGRCVKLTQKPISRMTNTYMVPTNLPVEDIFKSFNGLYLITADYGEINSEGKFVIIPRICRIIENGIMGQYVKISEMDIDINELFTSIELIGNDLGFSSTLFGGCGKEDQYPLLVSQGGPHILVKGVNCQ